MDSLVFCLFVVGFHFMPGVKSYQSLNNIATGYTFVVFEESQYDTNNWFHARKLCRQNVSQLADLAEITDDSDVTTVETLLATSGASNNAYWLGIHSLVMLPGTRLVGSLRTGQTLTFEKWDHGRPKSDDVRCGTVKRDNNKWRDEKCSTATTKYGVLCRFPMQPSILDPHTGCPPTMVPFDGKCYDFQMTSENVNFTKARETCEAKPGGGMVIPNSTMQEFVARYALLSGVFDFWLGVTDQEVDGEFKGIYGEALDSPKWSIDDFNGGKSDQEDCIFIISSTDSDWFDDDCSRLHGMLCVVDPLAYEASTPQQSASSPPTTDAVSSTASATVSGSVGYCKKTRRLLISLTLSLCPLMCWAVCLFM